MLRFALLCLLPLAFAGPLDSNVYSKQFVWEQGQYFQGDMRLTEAQMQAVKEKNGLIDTAYRWEGGVIPYVIENGFTQENIDLINSAFEEYHQKTCIRFVPRTNERDFLTIGNAQSGCWSWVGRLGGRQELNLQTPACPGCGSCVYVKGTPVHELMHAIGFHHEQTRWDRDDYVTIYPENIDPETLYNFDKYDQSYINAYGQPYDWGSVMHYSEYSFSINGLPTILSKPEGTPLGNDIGLTDVDATKINLMYNC